jgi:hypothetical protein
VDDRGKVCDSKVERQSIIAPLPRGGVMAANVMNSGDEIRKYQQNNDF